LGDVVPDISPETCPLRAGWFLNHSHWLSFGHSFDWLKLDSWLEDGGGGGWVDVALLGLELDDLDTALLGLH